MAVKLISSSDGWYKRQKYCVGPDGKSLSVELNVDKEKKFVVQVFGTVWKRWESGLMGRSLMEKLMGRYDDYQTACNMYHMVCRNIIVYGMDAIESNLDGDKKSIDMSVYSDGVVMLEPSPDWKKFNVVAIVYDHKIASYAIHDFDNYDEAMMIYKKVCKMVERDGIFTVWKNKPSRQDFEDYEFDTAVDGVMFWI